MLMKKEPKTVGFQLDGARYKQLEERGKKLGKSAGQFARELVILALDSDKNEAAIMQALNIIADRQEEIKKTVDETKSRAIESHNQIASTRTEIVNFKKELTSHLNKVVESIETLVREE